MYTIKVDRKHTLHVRHDGTIATVVIDGIRRQCAGNPVILDPTRLSGTVLRVECAEREFAQREFDALRGLRVQRAIRRRRLRSERAQ